MPKKPLELLLLGEGPVAAVLSLILRMPLVGRNTEDTEWTWPKVSLADKVKLLFVVPGHAGLDRIVRLHAEVWDCPKVSRLGVVMVVPDHGSTARLLERDVFGRKGITTSRFCDWRDVINIPRWQISLNEILDAVSSVAFLPIDTWRRESKNASCIPPLLNAIKRHDASVLVEALRRCREVHWDSICFPTQEFPNHHHYANAIVAWLDSVTPGVTPDWEKGLALVAPLSIR